MCSWSAHACWGQQGALFIASLFHFAWTTSQSGRGIPAAWLISRSTCGLRRKRLCQSLGSSASLYILNGASCLDDCDYGLEFLSEVLQDGRSQRITGYCHATRNSCKDEAKQFPSLNLMPFLAYADASKIFSALGPGPCPELLCQHTGAGNDGTICRGCRACGGSGSIRGLVVRAWARFIQSASSNVWTPTLQQSEGCAGVDSVDLKRSPGAFKPCPHALAGCQPPCHGRAASTYLTTCAEASSGAGVGSSKGSTGGSGSSNSSSSSGGGGGGGGSSSSSKQQQQQQQQQAAATAEAVLILLSLLLLLLVWLIVVMVLLLCCCCGRDRCSCVAASGSRHNFEAAVHAVLHVVLLAVLLPLVPAPSCLLVPASFYKRVTVRRYSSRPDCRSRQASQPRCQQ